MYIISESNMHKLVIVTFKVKQSDYKYLDF